MRLTDEERRGGSLVPSSGEGGMALIRRQLSYGLEWPHLGMRG